MAAKKIIIAITTVFVLVTRASLAQHYPDYNPQGGHHHTPFIDPMAFESDFTLFDPVSKYDLMDVKPQKRANYGFYGTYDRMYIAVTRPDAKGPTESGDFCYDWGYGNRYDFGYMTEEETGWLLSVWNNVGPGALDTTFRNRVDLINDEEPVITGVPGLVIPPTVTENGEALDFLPSGLNDFQYGYRVYREADSLNVIEINSFEINKTWRLKPYQHGGILEPFLGFRHMRIDDVELDSTYLGPTPLAPDGPVLGVAGDTTESFRTVFFDTENRLYGGQLGFRYFRYENRWTLSSEFRVLALENYWKQQFRDVTVVTEYGGIGDTPLEYEYISNDQKATYHDNEFVVGFDLRAEAAYQVTKGFALRVGIQILDLETGLIRGDVQPQVRGNSVTFNASPQDVQAFGFTFGAEINR